MEISNLFTIENVVFIYGSIKSAEFNTQKKQIKQVTNLTFALKITFIICTIQYFIDGLTHCTYKSW